MKRLAHRSQYFLRSPRLIKELVGHSTVKKTDVVYDIGAGSGIITSVLATRAGRVVAYENDPRMAGKLRANVEQFDNVEVIESDFLRAELPSSAYKVFANIPFHLSSPILRKLTESDHRPQAIYLIVQKQFANKLLIDDARFTGLLGAQIAPIYTARIRKRLQKSDYQPHPAVDTVFIELVLREKPLITPDRFATYRQFIADCYADPKIFAKMPQQIAGILPGMRPSHMLVGDWMRLFNAQTRY